jgi:serine/threonine-protein kinase
MADDHLPSPGDILAGKYRIERMIGRGGMGAVYAAEHLLLNQRVAVKLLVGELVNSEEATHRFMNEARAAAKIQGDHVARVLDIAQLPSGAPYMVMEFLEGSDLSGLLKARGVLTVPEVVDYSLQALDALAQAHAAGIVHRDLKPANLFLAKRHDGSSVVKVLDFGISKNLTPMAGTPQGMTQTRALLGSPEYMSPEQLRTPRGVDARTDIWSLGVILYELLTGRMPFTGEAMGELFMQIMEANPAPVRSHRADIPAALETIVMRCLSRDPAARYQTVAELAAALKPFASDQMRAVMAARQSSPGIRAAAQVLAPMEAAAVTGPGLAGSTSAPWANTGTDGPTGLPDARRSKIVGIIGGGALVLVVAVIGVSVTVKSAHSPAAAQGLALDSSEGTSTAAAPSVSVALVAAQPDAGLTATQAPAAKPPPVTPRPTPPPPVVPAQPPPAAAPVPVAPAPPPPAPAANKNCSTNYYFDKDGHKHFKPECF